MNRTIMLLAGRAAEELIFNQITTGAADDVDKTTDIARLIVTRFGMTAEVGQAVLEEQENGYLGGASAGRARKDYSEQTAREVDFVVRKLIEEAYDQAKLLLTKHAKDLRRGAELLVEHETITPEEFPP